MKLMKRIFFLAVVFVSLFSVFASGNVESENSIITVTDQIGREVTLNRKPQRIVSGYYISSSACIAMGMEDNLVAVEAQAEKRPIYKLASPKLINAPNVGTAKAFNIEACLSVEPDLVILPKKQKETAKALEELGIPSIIVNPESHEEIIDMFRLIGKATGREKEASVLIEKYQSILSFVENKMLQVNTRPVVYICGTGSYLTTAPGEMYQSNLIEMAGGKNASGQIEGSSWKDISYEMLIAFNPDVIIIPTNSNANGTPDYSVQDIMNDPQLKNINAVENKKIYQMPVGFEAWDSPVPSGALGTLWMLHTIHPEVCSEAELKEAVNSFYSEIYGFNAQF